jgi:hypothetical protein
MGTLGPASKPYCSYSGRSLCIGSCLGNPAWDRLCGRYDLLTGVSRIFLDFDAFQTSFVKVAILLVGGKQSACTAGIEASCAYPKASSIYNLSVHSSWRTLLRRSWLRNLQLPTESGTLFMLRGSTQRWAFQSRLGRAVLLGNVGRQGPSCHSRAASFCKVRRWLGRAA